MRSAKYRRRIPIAIVFSLAGLTPGPRTATAAPTGPPPPATPPPIAARLAQVSRAYLGTPYRLDPLGEGPAGTVDRDPLFDRGHVDCMTFVEQVLAEATAPRPADLPDRLRRIRYQDGVVGFRTRNHFTVTDWLPHNDWLVQDVTEALGHGRTREMVKVIDHAAFFRGHHCDPQGAIRERTVTRYIPREALPALVDAVPSGTLAIMVQQKPGIIAAHCGWLLRQPGQPLMLRHASSLRGRVVDEPLLTYLRRQPRQIVGLKLCVVRAT